MFLVSVDIIEVIIYDVHVGFFKRNLKKILRKKRNSNVTLLGIMWLYRV
jgi:hypothetical protein